MSATKKGLQKFTKTEEKINKILNLEKISKGVYMVNIISSDKSTVKRITIN